MHDLHALRNKGKTYREIGQITGLTIDQVQYRLPPGRKKKIIKSTTVSVTKRRQESKSKAIWYSGNSCIRCGYDRCKGALVFHHIDPETKSFKISDGKYRKWEILQPELYKCLLLCANCHHELHDGLWSPDGRLIQKQLEIHNRG